MTVELAGVATRPTPSGPVLFARYAYPPNRLGLCGPADAPALLDGAAAGADGELRELARGFEGAYPYLQLIAEQNRLPDPLDERVVDAYWLGSPLTAAVRPRAMHRDLVERFRGRMSVGDWRWLEAALAAGTRPMHAFHVLEIFPRVGLMRGGRPDPVVETMDACRIRWGRVVDVIGEQLLVAARRLDLVDGHLELGPERTELANGWGGPGGVLDGVEPGDWISLHWSWACDRLSPAQLTRLASWTDLALASANRSM